MKSNLYSLIPNLKRFSESLEKKAILVEQPWVNVDGEGNFNKLIFRKNNELVVSTNGMVTMGKWEYLSSAKSLMIEWGESKFLLNNEFVEKGVLILKYDGFSSRYLFLANENIIPDYNIEQYLKGIFYSKYKVAVLEAEDNQNYEVLRRFNSKDFVGQIGQIVLQNNLEVGDRVFQTKKSKITYYVKESKVFKKSTFFKITTTDKIQLIITSFFELTPSKRPKLGDIVEIGDDHAPDGVYKLGLFRRIKVKNGVIV